MKYRCTNPLRADYPRYGGRGIRVCAQWMESFEVFERDIGYPSSPDLTLDRIDNDGNYEPGNVRWATIQQQNNNQRPHYNPFRDGGRSRGEENFNAKISEADALEIRQRRAKGETAQSIARRFGIHARSVSDIAIGVSWKHIGGKLPKQRNPRDWDAVDDARVLAHSIGDAQLGKEIGRSLSSIRGRRFKLRAGLV